MILLTGGTGFVGRHLARQFVADRRPVRVLSRTPHLAALPDAVTWAQGDLGDPSSTRDALRDVHTVVHAAALDTGSTAASLEHTNVDGTTMLARIARDAGIRHFVHISSAGVYGDGGTPAAHRESDIPSPMTAYQRSKLAAEQTLMATLEGSGVPWTILRPPELYAADRLGTRIFFRNVARRRLWLHGPAHMLVQPTHVTDLVSAVLLVVDRERSQRQVINIGGARALELREWIAMVGERMNHSPLQFTAPGSMRGMATLATRAWSAVGEPPEVLKRLASTWINRSVNIEKARQLLGFEPVALEWGLDTTAADLLGNGLRQYDRDDRKA